MARKRPTFWGDLITAQAKEQGLSLSLIASKAGLTRTVVRNIAAGKTFGRVDQLEAILDVLGHDLDTHPRNPG